MTTFQLLLFIIAGGIFYLFFKQLFSGNHPKRGVDFEATVPDEQIGGINRADKTFSKPQIPTSRMEDLMDMGDQAIERGDLEEAKKAFGSLLILDENHLEALQKLGMVSLQTADYTQAKEVYTTLISLDSNDDMAYALLANALHQLGEEEEAKRNHLKAIELDGDYAPHHFNYANTLYDLGENKEALTHYTKAYTLDKTLEEAQKMMMKLGKYNEQ